MELREAFAVLANTIYLALALTVLGGAAAFWFLWVALGQLGLTGKRKRKYRRKKPETGLAPSLRPVPKRLLQLDLKLIFALWLSLAVLSGGLFSLNAAYQDIFIDKVKESYTYLESVETLPGGLTAVHLRRLGQTAEMTLYDEQGRAAQLPTRRDYIVRYFPRTRVLVSID